MADSLERRQVFELPPMKIEVTEHQAETKICSGCGYSSKADFADGVSGPTCYGTRVQAFALYLLNGQLLPYERTSDIFSDFFSLPISPGSLVSFNSRGHENLAPFERQVKELITAAGVAHFDESGVRSEKKLHWLHVASTETATHYDVHPKRGKEAMDDIGILPNFTGTAVHDHWQSYFEYETCTHSLCNAHHLRELTFIHEEHNENWAMRMKECLLDMNEAVGKAVAKGQMSLSEYLVEKFEDEYRRILQAGLHLQWRLGPLEEVTEEKKRGRKKQRPGKNLLDRLKNQQGETLAFMYNFAIPFTNNQGERDIRMNKVKEKISGCFRTLSGAKIFCRIRAYISTAKKQGWNILAALECAVRGTPLIPLQA